MRYATGQVAAGEWRDNTLVDAGPVPDGGSPADGDGAETPRMPQDGAAAPAPGSSAP